MSDNDVQKFDVDFLYNIKKISKIMEISSTAFSIKDLQNNIVSYINANTNVDCKILDFDLGKGRFGFYGSFNGGLHPFGFKKEIKKYAGYKYKANILCTNSRDAKLTDLIQRIPKVNLLSGSGYPYQNDDTPYKSWYEVILFVDDYKNNFIFNL